MGIEKNKNLYKKELLSPEKRAILHSKLYEYIQQEYLNPKLINFLADFIKTYEIHFTEKPIEEERLEKRERLLIESTKLPVLCVGFYELLELQREESKIEGKDKILDEEILKIIIILSSLLKINEINIDQIKKKVLEFFENRKNINTFYKDPNFTKKLIKSILINFGSLAEAYQGKKDTNPSKKIINEDEINSILNSSKYTNESIVGPIFSISEKYPILLIAQGLKTEIEYKGKKVKIFILPKLLSEIKNKKELRERVNTIQHESMHIIKDFITVYELLTIEKYQDLIKNTNDKLFLETMIEPLNYKIIDEISAHLSGFRDYYNELSSTEIDKKDINTYLEYLNSNIIENLKKNYLMINVNMFTSTFKSMVRNQKHFDEFVRKNTETMTDLIDNIFKLMKKYYQHVDLIIFTIGISDNDSIHKNIKRLETFLEKYSANQ